MSLVDVARAGWKTAQKFTGRRSSPEASRLNSANVATLPEEV